MARLNDIVKYCNDLLQIEGFSDYCPNGLQVQGKSEVQTLVTGVTASLALIERAIECQADALLVHHGYFWKGENPCILGMKYERIKLLIENNISLLAYHLPLDAHLEFGNNAQLARKLGFQNMVTDGEGKGRDLLFHTRLENPISAESLQNLIHNALERQPLYISGGNVRISTVGWCTGGAQSWIEQAADLGLDAFISGEISEQTTHVARERGIHFFAAGHHATERFGVIALGEHLKNQFDLSLVNVEIDNPV